MAIQYPLSLPTVSGIQSIVLRTKNATAISASPFTFKQQVVAFTGQRWEADITLPPMERADAEEWVAFLVSLKGSLGTFLLGDPAGDTPRGSAATDAGTPLVFGADQNGNILLIDGAPASQSAYLKAGDYIQLGTAGSSQFYKVLTDTSTNSSGQAAIDIYPDLRSSPADNAAVTVSNCKGVFRLNGNETSWSINQVTHYGITFGAVEAIA